MGYLSSKLWYNNDVVSSGGIGTDGYVFAPTQFYIGSSRDVYAHYKGWLDEVRISDIARSDYWLNTSYNTMNDPSSFFSVGSEETIP